MEYIITKMDNMGRGITYVDDLITFVPKTITGDIVELKVIKHNKKYNVAVVSKYIKRGPKYIDSICPYYLTCGGCHLLNLIYEDSLDYKITRVKELFKKYNNLDINPVVIPCKKLNYRNKLTIHIKDMVLGLVSEENEVININECLLVDKSINELLSYIKSLKLFNALIVIRSNYLNELLISITTRDRLVIENVPSNVVGIIYNDQVIYGNSFFIDQVLDYKFKVSYNSFFQVNKDINEELFRLIDSNINENDNVLDLYCGVGTLSLCASNKASKIFGIEIIENAIIDAKYNMELNKVNNCEFICGDVKKLISDVKMNFDTVIIDPPRKGIDGDSLNYIINSNINKIIYIACEPDSLTRDYNNLKDFYDLKQIYILDMFPYTYHCETICVLERDSKRMEIYNDIG